MRKPTRYVCELAIGKGGPTVPFKFGGGEPPEGDNYQKCSDDYEFVIHAVPEKQCRYRQIRRLKEPVLLVAKEGHGAFWTQVAERESAANVSAFLKGTWEDLPHMYAAVAGFFNDSGHFVPEFANTWFDVRARDACMERQERHKGPACKHDW